MSGASAARRAPGADGLRIGFAERDAAVAELGDHFAAGRLDQAEFEERADQATAARVQADLDALFADLPRGSGQRQGRRSAGGEGGRDQGRRPGWPRRPRLVPLLLVLLALAVVPHALCVLVPLFLLLLVAGSRSRWAGERRGWGPPRR